MRARAALLLLFLTGACIALQATPESVTIQGGVSSPIDVVFTFTNDEPRPLAFTLVADDYSTYLESAVTLSTNQLLLKPTESTNVQLRGTVPVLGPETHRLIYHAYNGEERLATITIRIPIDGTPRPHPKLDVTVDDVTTGQAFTVDAIMRNFGNIIAYYNLSVDITPDDPNINLNNKNHAQVTYPTTIQLLPGEEQTLPLLITEYLEPGAYRARITADVNQELLNATAAFKIIIADTEQTIQAGEALIITLTGTGEQVVEYTINKDGRTVLQDTITGTRDTIEIPTQQLAPGAYDVTVTVNHEQGTDTTRITLEVIDKRAFSTLTTTILIILALTLIIFAKPVKLRIRIALFNIRLTKQEKELKTLIRKAHEQATR